MATKYKLQDVQLLQSRNVLVDANVLIYLFWATGNYSYEKDYARVFSNLLKQKNGLFTSFVILSEVVNRVIRFEHDKAKQTSSIKYKDFRNSKDGKDALQDIYTLIEKDILKRFEVVGKDFSKQDLESFLFVDELDFGDKAIVDICKENSLVLLTNDRDFKNSDIDILTGNPHI